jgi:hypothetical protein
VWPRAGMRGVVKSWSEGRGLELVRGSWPRAGLKGVAESWSEGRGRELA